MTDGNPDTPKPHDLGNGKKHILLNAFDMSTVGHLSPGQWKNPVDKSATKRQLEYWIELAKLLERGGINALFLADTYGGYDTYEGSVDECIRRAAQWPITDPSIVSVWHFKPGPGFTRKEILNCLIHSPSQQWRR